MFSSTPRPHVTPTNEEDLAVIRGFMHFLAIPVAESSTKRHINEEAVSTSRQYRCVLLIAWQFCTFSTLLTFMQKMLANLFYCVLCHHCDVIATGYLLENAIFIYMFEPNLRLPKLKHNVNLSLTDSHYSSRRSFLMSTRVE